MSLSFSRGKSSPKEIVIGYLSGREDTNQTKTLNNSCQNAQTPNLRRSSSMIKTVENLESSMTENDENSDEEMSSATTNKQQTETEFGGSFIRKVVEFRDIEAWTTAANGEKRKILDQVSGIARPGELTFIMGASGSGKTTLLDILSGRENIEAYGDVTINGRCVEFEEMKLWSSYVQQNDIFLPNLTVKETLQFAAKFKNSKKITKEKRNGIVNELIAMMGLKTVCNTRVGSTTDKYLSSGEKKRLSFARETLTDPPILFCEEPTSGLDSFMSHQVMKSLRQLTNEGKTVICTIHQPTTSVFQMADHLIILAHGQIAYQGAATSALPFFARCGYPIQRFTNPSDHIIRITSQNENETFEIFIDRLSKIVKENHQRWPLKNLPSQKSKTQHFECQTSPKYPQNWFLQFFYIFHRASIQMFREKWLISMNIFQTVAMAILIGFVYSNLKIDSAHFESFRGFCFISLQIVHLLVMMPTLEIFWSESVVVKRECEANMYCPTAYFLAKTLADSIQYSFYSILYSFIVLSMIEIPLKSYFVTHFVSQMIIMSQIVTVISQAVGAGCATFSIAAPLVTVIGVVLMIFGGFLISFDSIPFYFQPIQWLSHYGYSFEIILVSYFTNIEKIEENARDHQISANNHLIRTYNSGISYLNDQTMSPNNFFSDYLALLLIFLFYKVVGLTLFIWKINK